jgi:DNA methylase
VPSAPALESRGVSALPAPAGAGTLDFDAGGHLYATHALHPFAARCPPPLVAWALDRYTSPGDTVLDPMAGSGTTLVEAALLGRRAWGAEIDPLARLIGLAKARPISPESIISARDRLASLLNGPDDLDATWRPELPDLQKWFRDDVCADLSRLRTAIPRVDGKDPRLRDLLWVAFSSLIVARTSVANARDLVHSRHHIRVWTSNPDVPGRYHARLTRMAKLMADYIERLMGNALRRVSSAPMRAPCRSRTRAWTAFSRRHRMPRRWIT